MSGYVPAGLKARVRAQAGYRCGYCRCRQEHVLGILEIEHIIPKACQGTDEEENLWLACRLCNHYKGTQTRARDPETGRRVRLFNPRRQRWHRHFEWSEDGLRVVGRTATGRATVVGLNMNNLIAQMVRRKWVEAGWHPPAD